ncbi:MAG: hypothetical protein COW71_09240 [Ignavibacteriales bacterium CG18_big_fil_WC_8_21_14_2_50_31_20]|nr:MAG: hypothetical protein COW71_09240 [Ignavibacteriales bacterium CG18_big_fil_WC_8_21_14_2_50_31_20]
MLKNNKLVINYKAILLLIILVFSSTQLFSQEGIKVEDVFSERTTKIKRNEFKNNLINNNIELTLSQELNDSSEAKWQNSFWAMELMGYKSENTFTAIKSALNKFDNTTITFQRALLEVVFTLYKNEFYHEISKVLESTHNEKIFAMAANHLIRFKNSKYNTEEFTSLLKNKFPKWNDNSILLSLYNHFNGSTEVKFKLDEIFSLKFIPNSTIIFCLQRKNRNYEGAIVIRNINEKFIRDNSGKIIIIPSLARSVTNLPYYITNGNSPQGFYSVQNIGRTSNVFIGPTPILELGMPFELSVNKFFHDQRPNTEWNFETYDELIPKEFRGNKNYYESFYAGMAGRTEIIAHGTTINPMYYKSETYYPNTPSLGCITQSELWDENTGKLNFSNQAKLIEILRTVDISNAYLLLIEIDSLNANIKLSDIQDFILKAEK